MSVTNEILYKNVDRRSNMYEVGQIGLGPFEDKVTEKAKSVACMLLREDLRSDIKNNKKIYRFSNNVTTLSNYIMRLKEYH